MIRSSPQSSGRHILGTDCRFFFALGRGTSTHKVRLSPMKWVQSCNASGPEEFWELLGGVSAYA